MLQKHDHFRIGQLILTDDPAKRSERFSSVENGGSSAAGLEQQHRLARQVSLRVRRKTIVRKAAARDTWQEAADKVRVSSDMCGRRDLRTGRPSRRNWLRQY